MTPQARVKVIQKAKAFYESGIAKGDRYGLCFTLSETIKNDRGYDYLYTAIPEFWILKIEVSGIRLGYWWPISDTASRIAAFDRMIELAKQAEI